MKIDRLIGIIVLLLNHRKITASELAGRFEVSTRTIYRDIDSLCRAGIPIVTLQGAGGGLEIMDGFALDRQLVSQKDLSSIITALKGLSSLFDDEDYVRAREKVESLIPAERRRVFAEGQECVVVDITPWGMQERYRRTVNDLKQAALNRRLVRFRYGSLQGEITEREVEPVCIYLKGYAWYLYAFCRLRKAYRYFKITRMSSINILLRTFKPREDANPRPMPDTDFNDPKKMITLKLLFDSSARGRAEEFFGTDQLEETEDGLRASVTWHEDEWVYGFLLSFGPSLTIESPRHVRDNIRARVKKILTNYEN